MSIHTNIQKEAQEALKNKEATRLSVLRGLIAAFTNENISQKRKPDTELSDDEAVAVIRKAAKQRRESIAQFEQGGRDDLSAQEKDELEILEHYLPQMMSKEEVFNVVMKKKEELAITDASQKGQLMGAVMKELSGKAEGGTVKEIVDSLY